MHLSPGVKQAVQGVVTTAVAHSKPPSHIQLAWAPQPFPFLEENKHFAYRAGLKRETHATSPEISFPTSSQPLASPTIPVPARSTSQVLPHPTQALRAERSSRSSFSRFEALRASSCVTFTRHCLSLQFLYPIVCRFALFYCKIHLPPIPLISDTRRVTGS